MINVEKIEDVVRSDSGRENKLHKIADTYGLEKQMYKLMEECGELVAASAKYDPHDYRTGYHLAEELADVKVMTEQIEYLLGIGETVQEYMDDKINRQIHRMRGAGMI